MLFISLQSSEGAAENHLFVRDGSPEGSDSVPYLGAVRTPRPTRPRQIWRGICADGAVRTPRLTLTAIKAP